MNAERRLERVRAVLACPACGGDLSYARDAATCVGCRAAYEIRDGRIFFISVPKRDDELDTVKGRLKHALGSKYYTFGVTVIAPTYPFNFAKFMRRWLDPASEIVIDAGSGNNRLDENVICLDSFDYPEVDVVCDLAALPLKPGSVGAVVTRSVLEHVPDPGQVVAGFERCTRPGGLGLHVTPFLFPFHASPDDYQRFTHSGLRKLFAKWRIREQTNITGPVTLALLAIVEFLSALAGGNRGRLRAYVYLALCVLVFPFKYLDVMFVGRARFFSLAPSFVTVVEKS